MGPFYTEWTFHVLTGVIAATAGVLGHRAWARRQWSRPPAGVVHEAVLAVDLADSTQLAIHYGDRLAMRARNFLEEQSLAAGRKHGVVFTENTGDGGMMTFSAVADAVGAAQELMRGLRNRPAELASGPALEIRAGIAYGVILLDASGHRHGATINRAFRLMSVADNAFVAVEGEVGVEPVPDRGRIFLDEEAADELHGDPALQQVGVCRLKGFKGFHRVFHIHGREAT